MFTRELIIAHASTCSMNRSPDGIALPLTTHCLGNLVLLTRSKNSQASNWEFDRKKSEYFSSRAGVSSFKLTTMVIKEKVWNRKTLEKRHYELLKKLSEIWDLNIKDRYD